MINSILIIGLIGVLFWASITDYHHMILPDVANLTIAILGIIRILILGRIDFIDACFGVFIGGGLLFCVRQAFWYFRRINALGFGDVKLLAAAGTWVGSEGIGPVLLIATLSALIAIVFKAIRIGELAFKDPIPFGPFIAFGVIDFLLLHEFLN